MTSLLGAALTKANIGSIGLLPRIEDFGPVIHFAPLSEALDICCQLWLPNSYSLPRCSTSLRAPESETEVPAIMLGL